MKPAVIAAADRTSAVAARNISRRPIGRATHVFDGARAALAMAASAFAAVITPALVSLAVFAVFALFALRPAHAADINAVNHAAQIASGVGAGSAVPSLGAGAVLQTILGLVVVIALVFGCAWLARRLGLQQGQRGGLVKTIGGTSLGGKERVAVVEIGDRWLVLGAAPGNVRLLCEMPAGSGSASLPGGLGDASTDGSTPTGGGLSGTFGQRFRDALKSEAARRLQRHSSGDR